MTGDLKQLFATTVGHASALRRHGGTTRASEQSGCARIRIDTTAFRSEEDHCIGRCIQEKTGLRDNASFGKS
jgi:hypothetical protein